MSEKKKIIITIARQYGSGGADTGKKLAALIMLILAIILLAPVLPYVLKAVVWIVMLPINGIAALIKAIKRKRQ